MDSVGGTAARNIFRAFKNIILSIWRRWIGRLPLCWVLEWSIFLWKVSTYFIYGHRSITSREQHVKFSQIFFSVAKWQGSKLLDLNWYDFLWKAAKRQQAVTIFFAFTMLFLVPIYLPKHLIFVTLDNNAWGQYDICICLSRNYCATLRRISEFNPPLCVSKGVPIPWLVGKVFCLYLVPSPRQGILVTAVSTSLTDLKVSRDYLISPLRSWYEYWKYRHVILCTASHGTWRSEPRFSHVHSHYEAIYPALSNYVFQKTFQL